MATTDYALEAMYSQRYPNTLGEMTKLIILLAKYHKNKNKKKFFGFGGSKKGDALEAVLGGVEKVIVALERDGEITSTKISAYELVGLMYEHLKKLSVIYPNWNDAYIEARSFFDTEKNILANYLQQRLDIPLKPSHQTGLDDRTRELRKGITEEEKKRIRKNTTYRPNR